MMKDIFWRIVPAGRLALQICSTGTMELANAFQDTPEQLKDTA